MTSKKKTTLAVIAGSTLGFIGILIGTSLTVTFPVLIRQFQLPLYIIQWLSSGYYLCATLIMSCTSSIMKSFSLKKIFITSTCLFLCGMIISFLSKNFIMLLLGCFIDAIATGLATPLMYQIVFATVNQNQFGKYNGIVTMIKSFGPAFGPTYGGILTSLFSWRLIFICVIPLLIIAFFIGIYSIPNNIKSNSKSFYKTFNFMGMILFSGLLITFSIFINQLGTKNSNCIILTCLASLILLFIFIRNNRTSTKEFLNFTILKNKIIKKRALNFFSLQFINLSIAFLLPIYCEEILHFTPLIAGLLTFPGALIGALISPLTGKYYDKYGAKKTLILSSLFITISISLFFELYPKLNPATIIILYIIFRIGYSLGFGNLMADAGKHIRQDSRSTLSALFNTFQQYSGSVGNNLMASIISILSAYNFSKIQALKFGGKICFALLTLIAVLLLVIIIMEKEHKHGKRVFYTNNKK